MKRIGKQSRRWVLAGILAAGSLTGGNAAAFAAETDAGGSAGSALIPLRAAAEGIGADVHYEAKDRSVVVAWGAHVLKLQIGQAGIAADGRPLTLGSPVALDASGRVVLPLATLNEALGIAAAGWSEAGGLALADRDYAAKATRFVHLLGQGDSAAARDMFDAGLSASLPEALLQGYWQQVQAILDQVGGLPQAEAEDNGVHENVRLTYGDVAQGPFVFEVRFDREGRIDDLYAPSAPLLPYRAPDYDDPSAYKEEPVVIGEGAFALPGTLTVPADGQATAVAVLVHGSGPNDRDESVGAVKTFRDLAVGLAKQGVATLRYEKRTREHTFQMNTPTLTVKEETTEDALLAAKKLAADPRFADKPVLLIGHSLGGMLVPRILNEDTDKTIDAAVILAGPSVPLEDLLLTQYEGLEARAADQGAPPETLAQLKAQTDAWKAMLGIIKDPQYSATDYPADLQLSDAAYWFDLRNNYGGEIAKNQTVPLLILQGDNDVQVAASNLDGWKSALASRSNVAYKLYPKLNHMLIPSDRPSTGAEYYEQGNVPLEVSQDIAAWAGKL